MSTIIHFSPFQGINELEKERLGVICTVVREALIHASVLSTLIQPACCQTQCELMACLGRLMYFIEDEAALSEFITRHIEPTVKELDAISIDCSKPC